MFNIIKILNNIHRKASAPSAALYQVSLVVGGTSIAQVINVLMLPVLSRLYSPSDFGILTIYTAAISILATISGLRYHLAIPLPKQDRYANAIVVLSLILHVILTITMYFCLSIWGDLILHLCFVKILIPYKLFLPLGFFFIGIYYILNQWAIRNSMFVQLGKTKVLQSIGGALIKTLCGLLGICPTGLLYGSIFGQCGGISSLACDIYKKKLFYNVTKTDIYRSFVRYRKFPIYSIFWGILNTIGNYMPQLFLSTYFSIQITGFYSMAILLLQTPAIFIGQALGQVFLQKASSAKFNGKLNHIILQSYTIFWKLACFPIFSISIFAAPIFSIVFGTKWSSAADFTLVLAPWIITGFVFSPMSYIYSIKDSQQRAFVTELIYFVLSVLILYVGVHNFSPQLAIFVFSLIGAILQLYRLTDILISLNIPLVKALFPPIRECLFSIFLIVPFVFLQKKMILLATIIFALLMVIYFYSLYKEIKPILL